MTLVTLTVDEGCLNLEVTDVVKMYKMGINNNVTDIFTFVLFSILLQSVIFYFFGRLK